MVYRDHPFLTTVYKDHLISTAVYPMMGSCGDRNGLGLGEFGHLMIKNIWRNPHMFFNKNPVTESRLRHGRPEVRPDYRSMSCDLRALAKMVQSEFGNEDLGSVGFASTIDVSSSPLFERGRFYDEYSARRNERLKRKKIETGDEKETVYDLGVKVETAKRRDSKKFESARKSASAIYSLERSENPSKENKKPPLWVTAEKSVGGGERKTGARRVRKI
ncbi:hypothetical protein L1049_025749 [Liquidambar formosana]|uniref:Uncharacterized protein n=1 Tax=Liquidambar formosana TaxID=63359 RepID=A0AAP0NCD7_LIQFO